MSLTLSTGKQIPAIELNKILITSYLTTEEMHGDHKISIQAKFILYGHDENGDRVYDPSGTQYIDVRDWRAVQASILEASSPEDQQKLLQLHGAYVTALAFIVQSNSDVGEVAPSA